MFTAGSGVTNTLGQGLYDSCFIVQEGTAIIAGTDNTTQYYVRNGELTVGGTARACTKHACHLDYSRRHSEHCNMAICW